jgi:hypothetical protein
METKNWAEAIWTCLLFLFFGYFGGSNPLSRSLLVFGAPLSILLQTRYLKLWLKTAFYMLMDPPLIFLSLLSAPQQAMLRSDWTDAYHDLYYDDGNTSGKRTRKGSKTLKQVVVEDDDDDDDDVVEVVKDEEDLDDFEDDEEEEEEDDDDDNDE